MTDREWTLMNIRESLSLKHGKVCEASDDEIIDYALSEFERQLTMERTKWQKHGK